MRGQRFRRRPCAECRGAADSRVQRRSPEVPVTSIDPFEASPLELRRQTEHRARCIGCQGSGAAACHVCGGGGRVMCEGCGGAGRDYSRSTRGAKCRTCKETGRVLCLTCSGIGKVACDLCHATGDQLVWWDYREIRRTVVSFREKSPILLAHHGLTEHRFLGPQDMHPFTPSITLQHAGPIPWGELPQEDEGLLASLKPPLDPRLERVTAQQYLRFGVVRRDVRYEMCGLTGTLSLSGATLLGARTSDAMGPIHLRMGALVATAAILGAVAATWHAFFAGPTAYFSRANSWTGWILFGGVIAGVVAAAGALRRLRPGFRWWPSTRIESAYAMLLIVTFVSVPLLALVARPTLAEARAAIYGGNVEYARQVVEALKATRPSPEVAALDDDLAIEIADKLSGDERVSKLDEVASLGGPRADAARERARQARIEAVRALLVARHPADALTRLDKWSNELSSAAEVPDLRAQAQELKAAQCADAACRFLALRSAEAARSSPARAQALAGARQELLAALEPKNTGAPDSLSRVRSLRAAVTIGALIREASPDAELSERVTAAASSAAAELAKVRLVGAPTPVANELLDRPKPRAALTGWPELTGVAVYVAEVAGRCSGLYVVGGTKEARSLSGKEPGLKRLLEQATGSPTAAVRSRPRSGKEHEVSTWTDGATPVLARWNGEELMELRIGVAMP